MEIGTPPLYSVINREIFSQKFNWNTLLMLGPYTKALGIATAFSERQRKETDRLVNGLELKGIQNNIAGMFLLFRGAKIRNEWIKKYDQASIVNQYDDDIKTIHLSGFQSCSRNLKIGLDFALNK